MQPEHEVTAAGKTTPENFQIAVTLIDEATERLARRYKTEGRGTYKALPWPGEYHDLVLRLACALTVDEDSPNYTAGYRQAVADHA